MGNIIDAQAKNFLGSPDRNLWFGLSSGSIIALDYNTGNIVYELNNKKNNISETSFKVQDREYLPFGELMQLNEDSNEIIGLRDNYFIRVDLNQPEIRREYISVIATMGV